MNTQAKECCSEEPKGKAECTEQGLKEAVRLRYAAVVESGCGCGGSKSKPLVEGYENLEGYAPEADYGLGCGLPTQHAGIKPGHTVLDLGSGAGNDAFVARSIVGGEGRVIGLDFTEAMVKRALENRDKLNYSNVEFMLGDIDQMPLAENLIDVVISNCVINLVPDKHKAFSEIFRVLKPGGHFCISDIVVNAEMDSQLRNDLALYAGCISGAVSQDEYMAMLESIGFCCAEVKQSRQIIRDREHVMAKYGPERGLALWEIADAMHSITFVAKKPITGGCQCQ
jgi:arsenite methyltransferase